MGEDLWRWVGDRTKTTELIDYESLFRCLIYRNISSAAFEVNTIAREEANNCLASVFYFRRL